MQMSEYIQKHWESKEFYIFRAVSDHYQIKSKSESWEKHTWFGEKILQIQRRNVDVHVPGKKQL